MPSRKSLFLLLTAIILLGAFFRLFRISTVPPGLYPDEAMNGNNALEAIHTGDYKLFYPENNGREGLFINIQALSLQAFGPHPWALRVVSAIVGTLTILGLYFVTREILERFGQGRYPINGTIAALLAAFFLAVSYWHINFSRISFRAISLPLLSSFGAYWLLKSLRTGKQSSAILGGIATGLGFHTYIAFRFIPFIFVVPIVGEFIHWVRGRVREHCLPCVLALYLFITFVVALPIGLYFVQHPGDFFGRSGQVSVFSSEAPLQEFVKSTVLTLGMINVHGDCNPRHNFQCEPELFYPVGVLFIAGFMLTLHALIRRWSLNAGFLLVWFGVMMLPATLTREGLPHALRAIGMIAPIFIMVGIGGAWLWSFASSLLLRALKNPKFAMHENQIKRIRGELALLVILGLIFITINSYYTYFNKFAGGRDTYGAFAIDLWNQGEFLRDLPEETQKIVFVNMSGENIRGVPAPAQTIMFATQSFEETERAQKNITYVTSADQIVFDPAKKVTIVIMNGEDKTALASIKDKFPDLKPFVPYDFLILEN